MATKVQRGRKRPRVVNLSTLSPAQRRLILALAAMAQEAAERPKAEAAA